MKEQRAEIVKSGWWLYGDSVRCEVWIIRQNWDYYWDEGFEDQQENLNEEGVVFHVLYARDGGVIADPSQAFQSEQEAIEEAETVLPSRITWDNSRLQPLYRGPRYQLSI